jgi:hypothetical protein
MSAMQQIEEQAILMHRAHGKLREKDAERWFRAAIAVERLVRGQGWVAGWRNVGYASRPIHPLPR